MMSSHVSHVVAVPFPGRGDINPLLNVCDSMTASSADVHVTFAVTEEWSELLSLETQRRQRVGVVTMPNVVPSERVRGEDILGFFQAVMTKMEAPLEELLGRIHPPPTLIIADAALGWAVRLANRRNIPVAVFFPMSASMFSLFWNFPLLERNGDFPVDLTERGNERVEYLPGLSPTRLVDLLGPTGGSYNFFLQTLLDAFSMLPKAQYLLLSTIYELEPQAIDAIRVAISIPIFTVGWVLRFGENIDPQADQVDYLRWLDQQPESSVLYVSMGSHLSVTAAQMDEILSGLRQSGVRFMLVARTEAEAEVEAEANESRGVVVRWCDQVRVLRHGAVGGFWSHCGWNSVKEGVLAGVPFLTFPLMADQFLNSKLIVEDWMIGLRVKEDNANALVMRHEIATKVKSFMDMEDPKSIEMRAKAKELQRMVPCGISESNDIRSFLASVSTHSV